MKTGTPHLTQWTRILLAVIASGAIQYSAEAQALPYGNLVSLWTFNGTSNVSFGPYSSTFHGTPAFIAGPRAGTQALLLTNNSYLNIEDPNALDFDWNTPFSATAWINGTQQGGENAVMAKAFRTGPAYPGWYLMGGNSHNQFGSGMPSVWLLNSWSSGIGIVMDSPTVVQDGTWHHLAFTYDGSGTAAGLHIYVDGVDTGATPNPDQMNGQSITNASYFDIGCTRNTTSAGDSPDYLNNNGIAEVSVWNTALSADDINYIYTDGIHLDALISVFSCNPSKVYPGFPVTLSWQVDPGATVSLDHGIGDVTSLTTNGLGSLSVTIETNTTFTLTAAKSGSATQTAQISAAVTSLIGSFEVASRQPQPFGAPTVSTLSWNIDPLAANVTITPDVGDVSSLTTNGLGTVTVAPANTTTYTLTVDRNSMTNQEQVTVLADSAPGVDDLVAFWKLDGNTLDYLGTHDGAWAGTGAVDSYAPGVIPGTLAGSFDMSNYIDCGASGYPFDGSVPFSISAWVKGDSTGTERQIAAKMLDSSPYTGWMWCANSGRNPYGDGRPLVYMMNAWDSSYIMVASSGYIADNNWHHLAFTYDGSSTAAGLKMYEDGTNTAVTVLADNMVGSMDNTEVLSIGCVYDRPGNGFPGAIANFTVWNADLSAENVAFLYDQTGVPWASPIDSFTANNGQVLFPGQTNTLAWQVAPGASVSIDQGIGDVTAITTNGAGSLEVVLTDATTFTLTAINGGVTETRTLEVNLSDSLASFSAGALTIPSGGSSLLSWIVNPLASSQIDNGVGDVSPYSTNGIGSLWVSPTTTTTYTLSVNFGGVDSQAQVTITVSEPLPATTPDTNSLVGYWYLDGNPLDATGAHNGVWGGTAVYAAGPAPGTLAASLAPGANSAVGNYIDTGAYSYAFDGTGPFSAGAWIKCGYTNTDDVEILSKMTGVDPYNGWAFLASNSHNPSGHGMPSVWLINAWGVNMLEADAYTLVCDNTWHYVAFTYDGSGYATGLKIYVDGQDTGALTYIGDSSLSGSIASAANLDIGVRDGANASAFPGNFRGQLARVSVWNANLSPENIAYIYQSGVPGVEPPQPLPPEFSGWTYNASTKELVLNFTNSASALLWCTNLTVPTANWSVIPNPVSPVSIPVDPAQARVFYRLQQ